MQFQSRYYDSVSARWYSKVPWDYVIVLDDYKCDRIISSIINVLMTEQVLTAPRLSFFIPSPSPSLIGKRRPLPSTYPSAFQPIKKFKIIEDVGKLDEDQISLGKESIVLSEGTVNSKSTHQEEAQVSPRQKKLRKNKESANKCRNKKRALMKHFNEEVLMIKKEEEELILKGQEYKQAAERINQKTDHMKRKVNLASIENAQLKGQLVILREKYRQTQSFVMSLIFPGGIKGDMKLL